MNSPFEMMHVLYMAEEMCEKDIFDTVQEAFGLSHEDTKRIWLAAPGMQEKFCRNNIQDRVSRGTSQYGMFNFIKRRYKLSEAETNVILSEMISNPNAISKSFIEIVTSEKLEYRWSPEFSDEIKRLRKIFEF